MARTAALPLLSVFRSGLQGEVLALLAGDPAVERTAAELARWTGHPRNTVATELRRLESAGLLTVRMIGRNKLVRVDAESPYFEPLGRQALMSFGSTYVIGGEFASLGGLERLFVYGSWAARYSGEQGPAPRDVDVLLMGRPDRDAAYEATRRAEERLGREVNVTIRNAEQWEASVDGFTRQLRSSPIMEIPLDKAGWQHSPEAAVTRWRKGEEEVSRLIEQRHLQRVTADPEVAQALLAYQELRPTSVGGHSDVVDVIRA